MLTFSTMCALEKIVKSLEHVVPWKAVQTLWYLLPWQKQIRLRYAPGVKRLFDTKTVKRYLGSTEVKDPDRTWTDEVRAQARIRWLNATPDVALTWGKELTGEAFVSKLESYASFDDETTVLEVGPGYGRILRSFLARGIPFKEYYAVDLSEQNIQYLRKQFTQATVHFLQADVEDASLPFQFDVGFSSLTFKHLYPSFETSVRNCSRYMNPGGRFVFDLIEGTQAQFAGYGQTYVRWYRREEILKILENAGLELVAFDEVVHRPEYPRLLVVATKSD
jgi:SAM-dependent methyltransferase